MAPGIWPEAWLCTGYATAFCVCTRTTRNLAYPYTFLASGICLAAATTSEPPLGGHVGSVPKRAGLALGNLGSRVLTFSVSIPRPARTPATVSCVVIYQVYIQFRICQPILLFMSPLLASTHPTLPNIESFFLTLDLARNIL